jgi:ADP-ribosylglycohydrolase
MSELLLTPENIATADRFLRRAYDPPEAVQDLLAGWSDEAILGLYCARAALEQREVEALKSLRFERIDGHPV